MSDPAAGERHHARDHFARVRLGRSLRATFVNVEVAIETFLPTLRGAALPANAIFVSVLESASGDFKSCLAEFVIRREHHQIFTIDLLGPSLYGFPIYSVGRHHTTSRGARQSDDSIAANWGSLAKHCQAEAILNSQNR